MKSMICALCAVAALALAAPASAQPATGDAQAAANEKLVLDYWRLAWQAHDAEAAARYIAKDEINHNPNIPSGFAGFLAHVKPLWKDGKLPVKPELDPKPAVVMAQGDLVLVVEKRARPDPQNPGKSYDAYWFDLFRIKDGKIAEHWDPATKPAK